MAASSRSITTSTKTISSPAAITLATATQSFPLALVGGGALPDYNTFTPTRVQIVSLSFVSVLTPSIVNEARLGWNRFAEGFSPQDRNFDPASIGLNTGGDRHQPRHAASSMSAAFPKLAPAIPPAASRRFQLALHRQYFLEGRQARHQVRLRIPPHHRLPDLRRYFRGRLNFELLRRFLAGTPDGGFQYSGDTNRNTLEFPRRLLPGQLPRRQPGHRQPGSALRLLRHRSGKARQLHQCRSRHRSSPSSLARAVSTSRITTIGRRASASPGMSRAQKTVVRAGFGIFYDAFSQDMFLGHLPCNSYSIPAPPMPASVPIPFLPRDWPEARLCANSATCRFSACCSHGRCLRRRSAHAHARTWRTTT